ncbi:RNA polymerase II transcription factor B subunit 1 [Trametes pubescens]|uniref:RNA polymerase II transcription factor B subunit 1 n=1 Tax=Trametes pubescens TaxID=154538 RepID=A0A1M2W7C1_TRAPU|nr:RNA polymerase II transcription factor B subunit 1 [Trametes pubescens]
MPSTVCSAQASYKKLPGLLELTPSHLQWTKAGDKAPSVKVPHSEAASLSRSKVGAAQVRLKVGLVSDEAGHNFTFTSPQAVALAEREKFEAELTNIIAHNRTGTAAPPPGPTLAAATPVPGTPTSARPRPLGTSARPTPQLSRASTSRAPSVASDPRGTPVSDPAHDFRLRKKVLLSTPDLAQLHRELVMGGQISENEFWEGREHLLLAQAAAEGQKKGKPGQLVDPRPQSVDGEVKIVITPQLVHDIFEEFPVVARAYSDNVPEKLSEAEFWSRYFQSRLFNAHRASIRSSAAQHVVKDDPIFDKYLEKDDDDLEPRRLREERVDTFIDLGATSVDHDETGNEKDVTMQAGKQRAVLPLIRKFNEHSTRLLDTALGGPASKRRRTDNGEDRIAQLDLEDLHDNETSAGILLDMQDRQRYFDGRANSATDGAATGPHVAFREALQQTKASMAGWSSNLAQLKLDKKAADSALVGMTQNVASRLDVKMRKHDIPDGLFRQMTTCQTAANEFLRQFWLAIYPPPSESQTLAPATPAQKAAKAAKMVGYLGKTHEKVEALVRAAHQEGVDPARVKIAMKPVVDAVDKALEFWRAKNAKVLR